MMLEILTSDMLQPLAHGFFTRRGGASSGVFAGLNCGYGSSDQNDIVRINRDRAADALEIAPEALVGVEQIHSAEVVTVHGDRGEDLPRADAMVTREPGRALAILTADCMPVLLADAEAGVVGAAHAGWRGARAGVIEATIDAMVELGARRKEISAAIGPCISQSAYEVGPDMMDEIVGDDFEYTQFFAQGDGDRVHFDLAGYGLQRLRDAGIGAAEWLRHCTYSDERRFFSYRRSVHRREADYGRLISVIRA
ncbi:peptidoglycan editing factor PgeF [Palleronia sp. LCG004]|uniref:peptidoglycan editing factor PgeF n=1 Tax=Palleronia sp. LCG004 TaxID=3079304 RepID=UPI002941E55C|nr:peptidoglycan editing factor PgeF [Palleronia sp. LCG004]WOI57616.1 peptidoglycan editing factor PgeF [Palleronia sp. LCG004]